MMRAGVSPHAPYTVSPAQLKMISRLAIDENLPLMMHAAESEAERLFVTEGAGAFAEGLRKRGIEWRAPGLSTIQHLEQCGVLAAKPLLAHCINVDDKDLETIKANDAAIAHCPKSNAKLGHGHAPFTDFLRHGLKVGFGSDSVASNNTCDILEEARFATLLARLPSLEGRRIGGEGLSALDPSPLSLPKADGKAGARTISAGEALFAAT